MKTRPASGAPAWSDADDAPRLTKSFLARAEIRNGEKLLKPARARPKRPVALRLEPDVVEVLQASGADWPTRANAALRAAFAKTS